tara:strand:+ start:181 stop:687 length:507 start_codon:yes stop_codon:yes gene_type:complete
MKHKHHIIPRYSGGSDDASNLVELTPTQHSMWHYAEYLRKGNIEDWCASRMILGDVNKPEFRKNASRLGNQRIKQLLQEDVTYREKVSEIGKRVGPLGYNAQREKFDREGKTIAEQSWLVTTPTGEELKIVNLAKFCREHNLLKHKMCEVSKGKWRQHRGYSVKPDLS